MIIGITGTLGAGKGTIVHHLVRRYGFEHYSVREFLNREIARRGLSPNRDTQVAVANELRERHGAEHLVKTILEAIYASGGNAVVESIRSVGEAEYLKRKGAVLWAVDADAQFRYGRIIKRATETDAIPFEKFMEDERRELKNNDPKKQSLLDVISRADMLFTNNGTETELMERVDDAIRAIMSSRG